MRTNIFIAFAAASLCTSLFAAVKPLAIWNGEFTSTQSTRNDVKLGIVGTRATQYFEIKSGAIGTKLTPTYGVKMGQAIIVNISNIGWPSNYSRVLFDYVANNVEQFWFGLDTNKKIDLNALTAGAVTETTADYAIDFDKMHSFGMMLSNGDGAPSYGVLDGVPVHESNITMYENLSYIVIGTRKGIGTADERNNILTGAHVSYIAVFPENDDLSLEDFKTWSLYNMTRAETATNVTDAVAAGRLEDSVLKGGKGVGVNLLGGTYRVKDNTKAHALFVQGNSIIEFSGDSPSLTLEGPVYISTNCTLTLNHEGGGTKAALKASHFAADEDQIFANGCSLVKIKTIANFTDTCNVAGVGDVIVKASDENGEPVNFDITEAFNITDDNAGGVNVEFAPEPPTFEETNPIQFVGDDIVFGVKTMPGLWYASVATNDVTAMNSAVTPMTIPFMATNSGARITAPTFVPPLMFYKIIVAPSRAAFEDGDE